MAPVRDRRTAEVGDDVTLYHGVTLGGTSWSPGNAIRPWEDRSCRRRRENFGPITVGRGTRVGANSVVIESTPPEVTVVGSGAWCARNSPSPRVGRIDLDHHLMPDPVARQFGRLDRSSSQASSPICRSGCATAAVPHGTTRGGGAGPRAGSRLERGFST